MNKIYYGEKMRKTDRRWSPEEDKYILDNSGKQNYVEMAKHLGRTPDAVRQRAVIQLDLHIGHKLEKKVDFDLAKQLAEKGKTCAEIGRYFGVAPTNIGAKFRLFGIPYKRHEYYQHSFIGNQLLEAYCQQKDLQFIKLASNESRDYIVNGTGVNVKYSEQNSWLISRSNLDGLHSGDEFWLTDNNGNLFKIVYKCHELIQCDSCKARQEAMK